ncbi:restriction endonuclease subunit S [Nitrosomonas sp.]|uniref:restriction endonuclease subunit S n=1 Tax=Nitrosomonas sp. TaxID=42353 RepID=UPI00272F3DF9|nr:restriction endonuclease subunit S [Nitrosomonas sp.]MDP1787506.1 restriction endonuclease subunit S [Nitrosomonas sp.]
MSDKEILTRIGIKDLSFDFLTISQLVKRGIIEKPLDGNHGEIHPKSEDFVNSGIPFIMASDINNGAVDYINCKFITKKQADNLRKGFAKSGDVLLTHKATIGRTAIIKYDEQPYVMLTPQVTYYRVRDQQKLDRQYLCYFFESPFFQDTLSLWASSGSTRAYLGITEQGKLPFVLPPINKQRKIAAIISAYDELIENNQQRIALQEKMAEEIYREWFVRLRFPGHEKVKKIKGMPEGWEVETLGRLLAEIIDYRGITPAKLNSNWENKGIIALSALNVKNGRLIKLEDAGRVSEALYERWMRKKLEPFDILLTSEAPLGQVYMLMDSEKYVLSQRLFGLRANPKRISPCYLYHYLLFPIGQNQLIARATGSTVGGIRQQLLKQVEVVVPTESLLKSYTEIVQPMFKCIYRLSQQNDLLTKSRDMLLPRLISGKLSVEHLDIQFPPGMEDRP